MKQYYIKPEYLSQWGADTPANYLVSEAELNELSREWEKPVDELLEQLVEIDNPIWYAVQRDREDDWGTGSFDREEAIRMAKEQREDYPETLVAAIENDVCVEEITDF